MFTFDSIYYILQIQNINLTISNNNKGGFMKKLLVLFMALVISSSASYASSFWKSFKNAVKQDARATRQAIKTDINNSKKEQAEITAARKKESLKEVNNNINSLNKEMVAVKNDKNISETERTIKVRLLQKQINFYNKQKKEIQKW